MSGSGSLTLRTLAWCTGVLLAGAALLTALVLGLGAVVGPAHSDPAPGTDVRDFVRLAATDPAAALRSCTEARRTDFYALAAALREGAVPSAQRYAVVDGPLRFLSAPVPGAGSAGDRAVWVWGARGHAAVTDDARALSPELPGTQFYGITAEAPGAQRAAACVDAALRVGRPGVRPTLGPDVPDTVPDTTQAAGGRAAAQSAPRASAPVSPTYPSSSPAARPT